MSEFENNAIELSLEELDQIGGGYKKPAAKAGFIIYQIKKGENLTRIASAHQCSINDLLRWNPKITNKNVIYAGDYLYIKVK